MEVFFLRHGQTDGNLAYRHQHSATTLNEHGVKQVEIVLKEIGTINPTRIITSTQLRAVQTARILSGVCQAIPETQAEFEELRRPDWLVGRRYFGYTSLWYMWRWFLGFSSVDGETYQAFIDRVTKARHYLESLPANERILIVSHTAFSNLFIEHLCLKKRMNLWQATLCFIRIFTYRNAGIVHLRYSPGTNSCPWSVVKR